MQLNLIVLLEEKLRIPSKTLTENEIEVILIMMSNQPENFRKIECDILKITADKKVDIKDIQEFVPLICMLFTNPMYKNVHGVEFLNIIQFIIDVILDSGYIDLPAGEICNVKIALKRTIQLLIRAEKFSFYKWFKSLLPKSLLPKSLFSCSCFKINNTIVI
jgi:hypothetical protein